MNINDWKTIQTRNDVKFIKSALANSSATSVSIIIDLFLVLLAFSLDRIFDDNAVCNFVWIAITTSGLILPIIVWIIGKKIAQHHEQIAMRIRNTRELVQLFDDEVCYLIMSADSFYSQLAAESKEIDISLFEFLLIESSYYLNKSVKTLDLLSNQISCIIRDGTDCVTTANRISPYRLANAIRLIVNRYMRLSQFSEIQKSGIDKASLNAILDENKYYIELLKNFIRCIPTTITLNLSDEEQSFLKQ